MCYSFSFPSPVLMIAKTESTIGRDIIMCNSKYHIGSIPKEEGGKAYDRPNATNETCRTHY